MALKIEITVKDKHTIEVHSCRQRRAWLVADAGDDIINVLEKIVDHYNSVFESLRAEEYYGDHS